MTLPDSDAPRRMGAKDIAGLMCCLLSACGAALGYKILDTAWIVGFAVLGSVGFWLLLSARRQRRLSTWMMDAACEGDAGDYGGGMAEGDD
jgi:hypothetical protein